MFARVRGGVTPEPTPPSRGTYRPERGCAGQPVTHTLTVRLAAVLTPPGP